MFEVEINKHIACTEEFEKKILCGFLRVDEILFWGQVSLIFQISISDRQNYQMVKVGRVYRNSNKYFSDAKLRGFFSFCERKDIEQQKRAAKNYFRWRKINEYEKARDILKKQKEPRNIISPGIPFRSDDIFGRDWWWWYNADMTNIPSEKV